MILCFISQIRTEVSNVRSFNMGGGHPSPTKGTSLSVYTWTSPSPYMANALLQVAFHCKRFEGAPFGTTTPRIAPQPDWLDILGVVLQDINFSKGCPLQRSLEPY